MLCTAWKAFSQDCEPNIHVKSTCYLVRDSLLELHVYYNIEQLFIMRYVTQYVTNCEYKMTIIVI